MTTHARTSPLPDDVEIAIIGGSGLSSLPLSDARRLDQVPTPFGGVSDVVVGDLSGRRVAFLARHGQGHRVPPHLLDSRAQLWLLARSGAKALLSTNAVGSLDASLRPGSLALTAQLIDRTWGRHDTYFDGSGPAGVQHLAFGDPYSAALSRQAAEAIRSIGEEVTEGATSVVIQGPRFSTRAEARWHRAMGASLVNMTQLPEAALAAELGLAHVNLAIVTDTDTEHGDEEADSSATAERVFAVMAQAQPRLSAALAAIVAALDTSVAEPPRLPHEASGSVLALPTDGALG